MATFELLDGYRQKEADQPLSTAAREYWQHRAVLPEVDDGTPLVFKWHFPRGTFPRGNRISALELAAFLMPHMPSILPLLGGNARIQTEFAEILQRFVTWPKEVLDEVSRWCRSVVCEEEDEIVELDLRSKRQLPAAPVHFLIGGRHA